MTQTNDESEPLADELQAGAGGEAPGGESEAPTLAAELEAAQALAEDNHAKHLRALADLENLRKRTQRELENARKYGLERLAGELLPVRDSLEAAVVVGEEGDTAAGALVDGTRATLKLLDAALAQFAIEVIDPHGAPFDPNFHEAISIVDAPDAEPNTVVAVFQKGFRIHERLLRPARVVVSKSADS